ncbi:MAG: hypothetical protein E7167_04120 [Firmicutes bacterium]|nr:hypothetical protein [Bacillota bacterium]
MKNFTKEMINDYANKLLFDLSEEEADTLLEEFDIINENMEIISSIEGISEVEPQSFACEFSLTDLREDIADESLSIEDILVNCDAKIDRVVEVPKVVG